MPRFIRIAVTVLPITELALFILVAQLIGFGNALLIQLGSMALGLIAIQLLGAASLRDVQASLVRQEAPGPAMVRGACILLGGALMILPGFLTDLLGLLLLIPGVPRLAGRSLWVVAQTRSGRAAPSVVLDGDWHEVPPTVIPAPNHESPWTNKSPE